MTRAEARALALGSAANLIYAHLSVGGVLPQGTGEALEVGSADYAKVERELRAVAESLARRGGLE